MKFLGNGQAFCRLALLLDTSTCIPSTTSFSRQSKLLFYTKVVRSSNIVTFTLKIFHNHGLIARELLIKIIHLYIVFQNVRIVSDVFLFWIHGFIFRCSWDDVWNSWICWNVVFCSKDIFNRQDRLKGILQPHFHVITHHIIRPKNLRSIPFRNQILH